MSLKLTALQINKSEYLCDVKDLDYCSTHDEGSWRAWRFTNRKTPTSSLLSSYFGHGYVSYNQSIVKKITTNPSDEEENKPSKTTTYKPDFKKLALEHGVKNEVHAKDSYLKYIKKHESNQHIKSIKTIENGETSRLVTVKLKDKEARVIVTPDLILELNGKMRIVEFKCPYFALLKKKSKTVSLVAVEFLTENTHGKESSFIQAAVYAMVNGAKKFTTCYYFTDGAGEDVIIVYNYRISLELVEALLPALLAVETDLAAYEKSLITGEKIKFRSKNKLAITGSMKEHFINSQVYFPCGNKTMNFDTSNDSTESD